MRIIPNIYKDTKFKYFKQYNPIFNMFKYLNPSGFLTFGEYKYRDGVLPKPKNGFKIVERYSLPYIVVGFDSTLSNLYLINEDRTNKSAKSILKFNLYSKQIDKIWNFTNGEIGDYYFTYFTLIDDNTIIFRAAKNLDYYNEVFYYAIYDLKNEKLISINKENGSSHGGNCCYDKLFIIGKLDTINKVVYFIARDSYNSDYKILKTNYTTGFTQVIDNSVSKGYDYGVLFKIGNYFYYDDAFDTHALYYNNFYKIFEYSPDSARFYADLTKNGQGYAIPSGKGFYFDWGNYYDFMYWFDISTRTFIKFPLYDENGNKIDKITFFKDTNMSSIDLNGNWWVSDGNYVVKIAPF